MSINGLDASTSILAPNTAARDTDSSAIDPNDPCYEPYDTRLTQKLRDLYAALEEETTQVAELRRDAPAKAAAGYVERLRSEMQEHDREFEANRLEATKELGAGLGPIHFRDDNVQQSWSKGRKDLEALRNVTKVKADLERASKAVAEVGQV